MPKRTTSYHAWLLTQLSDPQTAADYVNDAIADSPELLPKVLRNVAEARKMSRVAEEAGVNRESLYRALSEEGNPTLDTLNSVLSAVGLRILVGPEQSIPVVPSATNEPNADITFNTGQTLNSTTESTASIFTLSYERTTTASLRPIEPCDVPVFLLAKEKTTDHVAQI